MMIGKLRLIANQKGFSLTEIMVTVAIVGILTTIAIPNYQSYQRRSKQSEAKMLLSSMYTSESVFILNWSYGTPNLKQMGFKATGDIGYNTGFGQKAADGCNTNNNAARTNCPGFMGPIVNTTSDEDLVNISSLCATDPCTLDAGTSGYDLRHFATALSINDVKVNNIKSRDVDFKIGATKTFGNGKRDSWTINHNKVLMNVESGI